VSNTVKVTRTGRAVISGRMIGSTPTQAEPLNIGWGTGGVGTGSPYTAGLTDVNAFGEAAENRVAGTSSQVTTTTTDDTYQVVGTLTSASAQTIAEALLSDSATKPFATTVASGAGTVIGSSTNTSMNVAASYTPANATYVQVDTEVMEVTAGHGTTSLTVTRGQNGSAAISTISAGDVVTLGNPPGVATANATQFVHATFTGLALNTSDSISLTFAVQFTSS
jgi:hypothetical protein